jgi:hypothetical protein
MKKILKFFKKKSSRVFPSTISPRVSTISQRVSTISPRISTISPRISTISPRISTISPRISTTLSEILPPQQYELLNKDIDNLKFYLIRCSKNIKKILKENISDDTKERLIEYNRFINNILLDNNNLYNFNNINNFKNMMDSIKSFMSNLPINILRGNDKTIILLLADIESDTHFIILSYNIFKDTFIKINSKKRGGVKYHLKITKNKVKILYNKKEYKRTIFINKNNKKFVKINNKFLELSKLKKI